MVSSKPRSGSSVIARKTTSSVNSKTVAASKHRKGTLAPSEIDSKSPKSLEAKPTKFLNLNEKRVVRGSEMQQQLDPLQEELKKTKERLGAVEEEKHRAFDELREMKRVAEEANMRLSAALTEAHKSSEIEKSRIGELERASIESAKKRDQAWQLELEAVQKQHAIDMEALSSTGQELGRVRRELALALEAKDVALKKAEDAGNVAEANAKRVMNLSAELISMKESLANFSGQLDIKEKKVEALKLELERAKQLDVELVEKEASMEKLKQELSNTKESESCAMDYLSESKKTVQILEVELEKAKESETKMLNSLISQTKQFEQTKILLEEAKVEVTCLHEKIESLEASAVQSGVDLDISHRCLEKAKMDMHSKEETFGALKSELQVAKECLARAQEGEALALLKADTLAQEISLLRTELKLATEAEEKSKKAMDDLALALKEVSMEANEGKGKISSIQSEQDNARGEVEHLKQVVKSTEEKYQRLLDEARKEIDQVKDQAETLKLEAEESNLAWNEKVIGFISCIKRAEEECNALKQDNSQLMDKLRGVEDTTKVSKEDTYKLRDILKQALNEANVAKEAAEIAKAENSELKDSLADKDNALLVLTRDNEHLRINEAAALENIKELKRLLSTTATTDLRAEDKEMGEAFKKQNSKVKEYKDSNKLGKVLNPDLEDVRVPSGYKDAAEDPERAETLKGSIFDMVNSPGPVAHHRRASSSVFTDDAETINSEDFDHLDGTQIDDMDHNRNPQRKKKALLRRFGDLLKKTSLHRRDTPIS